MEFSDITSIAAIVVSIAAIVISARSNPKPSLEVDEARPERVEGRIYDSEWPFVLKNRGRGRATYVRIWLQIDGKRTQLADDIALDQGQEWQMDIGMTRDQLLALENPMTLKTTFRVIVRYRGMRDGVDKELVFYPPAASKPPKRF